MHFASGSYFVKDEEDGRFTLLEELFLNLPKNVMYSIDMKDQDEELVNKANLLVRKYRKEDKVIWGSMFQNQHKTVKRANPKVSVFYSG